MKPDWKLIPEFTGQKCAPFDGEAVLIWKPNERMVGEYMMMAYFDWDSDDPRFIPVGGIHKLGYISGVTGTPQDYPTHWAPAPLPPESI